MIRPDAAQLASSGVAKPWARSAATPAWSLALALLLTSLVGVLDYVTGYELRLGSLYLLPIALATWRAGRRAGLAIAAVASACWVLSFSSTHGYTRPGLFYWDGTVMAATFLVFVVLLARLRLALLHADERFVRLLEEMHAAVYVVDRSSGEVLYANRRLAQMLDTDPRRLSDAQVQKRFAGSEVGAAPDASIPGLDAAGFSSEERRDPATGRWYLVQSGPIPWEGGRVVSLKVVTDITDRRHAQALRRENQDMLHRTARLSALAETTAALAHEINQPLMAIASYNDACQRLLTSETPDRAELLRALEKSRAQAIRAANILTRMREFVRSKQPQPVLCELNGIVREALELLETRIEHEGVVAEVDLAEHLPPLLADRFLLVQVVVNLLENAVDAMRALAPPRRRLTVSTERQGDRAVGASIADSGSGISAAIGERLGTPFVSTKPQGLGLGLSICRSVVEAHGGRLWHSPNPEGGTIFHFTVAAEAG